MCCIITNIVDMALSQIILLLFLISIAAAVNTKPNIVFVLVDDWGYADVSFRNPAIYSPNFERLATKEGLILDRHYVFKYCSPSRASFLTGRFPHHAHQWNPPQSGLAGANINMTMIPAKLKQAGYKTHMVGKWHEGFHQKKYLPINRGFDTMSGFLGGAEDHMTQKIWCAVDYWKNDAIDTRNGTYDADTYKDDLTNIIKNHNPSDPFFLYLPLHNVHAPIQAPEEWVNLYAVNSTCSTRRVYQAMVSVADNVTGTVVQLLQDKGMWDNTLLVVSADNGGAPCQGSNYPLKGSKMTFYEGGVRSLAFVSGGLLPSNRRGKTTGGFIHIADWYTTFSVLAGVDHDDSGAGKFPVDGMDVWPIITGENEKTLHEQIPLGYHFKASDNSDYQGALIVGNHKLIVGSQGKAGHCDTVMWSPLDYPCSNGPEDNDCTPYCLFDIIQDPNERHNLAKEQPDLLNELLARYNKYGQEPSDLQNQGYDSNGAVPNDPNACTIVEEKGGYWYPWAEDKPGIA